MLEQSRRQSLVMGIAPHPDIMGAPFRLRALRRALSHIGARRRDIWLTTPGRIAAHYAGLFPSGAATGLRRVVSTRIWPLDGANHQ